jgi:predicted DNA-binding protein (UPF0251 family)
MVRFVPNNPCFHPQIRNADEIVLTFEEVEAIRLSDFMSMDQDAASESMDVSRGTFQRIIKAAHYKLADALVNGKTIRIQGGNYEVTTDIPCCKEHSRKCRGKKCSKCDNCEGGI